MTIVHDTRDPLGVECLMPPAKEVLDHGYVRLVDFMGNDLSVVRAARVSYDADWRAGSDTGSDERLIRRLWRDKHTSPFEAVTFTFEVKAPIFVFRQWHRHRTWSFNEISARYSELPEEVYAPEVLNVGVQSTYNKQGRDSGGDAWCAEFLATRAAQIERVKAHAVASFVLYRELLADDWPRELARAVLPVATYSRMFATVDLLNLLKFFGLRDHEHAQYEIRVYAEAMRDLIEPIVPVCMAAFKEGRQ